MQIIATSLFLILLSISNHVQSQDFEQGKIIVNVVCKAHPSQSYALYLPSNYDKSEKWPVIYFLDAAARGTYPLDRFAEAAEKYGYILIGSNNSKNGPWDPIFTAVEAISIDAELRFNVDENRRYISGFSGGARSAAAIGMLSDMIRGVIGCGAGFAYDYQPNDSIDYLYVGVISNGDMNYTEMQELTEILDELNVINTVIEFEGGHDWPDTKTASKVLRWLELLEAKRENNEARISGILEERVKEAAELEQKNIYLGYLAYKQIDRDFEGVDIAGVQSRLIEMLSDPFVISEIHLAGTVREEESNWLQRFMEAQADIAKSIYDKELELKSAKWWANRVEEIREIVDVNDNSAWNLMYARLIDYLWRTSFIDFNRYYSAERYTQALKVVEVWEASQPQSPAPPFNQARVYASKEQKSQALKALKEAADKGMSNVSFMDNEPSFSILRDSKKYNEIRTQVVQQGTN